MTNSLIKVTVLFYNKIAKGVLSLKLAVVVPAAGVSVRMQAGKNKAFVEVLEVPIIIHTLEALGKCSGVEKIYVVVRADEIAYMQGLLDKFSERLTGLQCSVVAGGAERQQSVYNALCLLTDEITHVAVHDGARPFITREVFADCLQKAVSSGAAIVAVPCKDTIKVVSDSLVEKTLERASLRSIQTPQIFEKKLLKDAYDQAETQGYLGTDDASLVEFVGHRVVVVMGDYQNIKLTTPEDLLVAESFWRKSLYKGCEQKQVDIRFGQGYDVHKLVEGRELILGGVNIPYHLGLLGHSDADVLLHEIKDALLGACGLGDIGDHFPDTSEEFKGISSLVLLQRVNKIIRDAGFVPNNIDAIIMAEKPKLAPFKESMKLNIALALDMDVVRINIKATTTEKLGFVGRQEGMAAQAIASVIKN